MPPRLLYATPTGGHPTPAYMQSARAVEMGARSFGVRRPQDFMFAVGPVQMARSKIAQQTVEGACAIDHKHSEGTCRKMPFDYVIQHDDDLHVDPFGGCWLGHEHDGVSCKHMGNPLDAWRETFEADPTVGVIGAVYFREHPMLPNITIPHPTNDEENCHVVCGLPAEPFEVAAIATGFMMVKREVFERLFDLDADKGPVPMFRFAMRKLRSGFTVEEGEDYDFCRRVRAAGFKVIADPRVSTIHMKASGRLHYQHAAWEQNWNPVDPATGEFSSERQRDIKANVEALRAGFARNMKMIQVNGLVCVDHTEHRAAEIASWQEAQARRKPQAA